jgi:antagonist of KipI
MSLSIIKAGICDTFQDEGRKGFQHLGINPAGVMDKNAMRIANLLAGNEAGTAVLEMHFPAAVLHFDKPCLIALAGADFGPSVNGKDIPVMHPVWISAGTELRFRKQRKGGWCYLAVHGGFILQHWLRSAATHLKAGKGGWNGRRLLQGDTISFATQLEERGYPSPGVMPWSAMGVPDNVPENAIAMVTGKEWTKLKEESRLLLLQAAFIITPSSDRMGYSLKGPALFTNATAQLLSSAAGFGTVQLLPDGQLIVLMADHQTTGGYPCVGHVISAHWPKLAQHRPGDSINFYVVTHAAAEQLWLEQYRHLKIMEYACRFKAALLNLR